MIVTRSHVRAVLNRAERLSHLLALPTLTDTERVEVQALTARLVDPPMRRHVRNTTARERNTR